jgi:hypothetical protein
VTATVTEGGRLPEPGISVLALADELHRRGLRRLYARACPQMGVLSVATGLTVWTDGHTLRWEHDGQHVIWPATDTTGAATWLAGQAQRSSHRARPEPPS